MPSLFISSSLEYVSHASPSLLNSWSQGVMILITLLGTIDPTTIITLKSLIISHIPSFNKPSCLWCMEISCLTDNINLVSSFLNDERVYMLFMHYIYLTIRVYLLYFNVPLTVYRSLLFILYPNYAISCDIVLLVSPYATQCRAVFYLIWSFWSWHQGEK